MNFLPKPAKDQTPTSAYLKYYQIFPLVTPRRRAAAERVLRKRQTVVISRTPHGIGVMALAGFAAASIIFFICYHCLPFFDRANYSVMVT
jgi:hypothetical protein